MVMEDYFTNSDSFSDTELLSSSFNKWVTACDQICQRHLGVQRAFSSNGFWLLHRLSDLRYIHQVIESISQMNRCQEMFLMRSSSKARSKELFMSGGVINAEASKTIFAQAVDSLDQGKNSEYEHEYTLWFNCTV